MTTTEYTLIGLMVLGVLSSFYTNYRLERRTKKHDNTAVFIDTSVLMDGRIVAIAQNGFMPGGCIIPRSVISEMQFLADNADTEKRDRARSGLDVVNELQAIEALQVTILQDGSRPADGVDERLLALVKKYGGVLCTIDYNLNKVATVEGIRVLNVNELAKQLRMQYLPGDHLQIELTTRGSDSHQAVGHSLDGTMVVVEHASKKIGSRVEIEVIRSIQTAAGRMMFARLWTPDATPVQSGKALPTKRGSTSSLPRQGRNVKRPTGRTPQDARQSNQTKTSKRTLTEEDRLIDLVDRQ
jgi:uncharacterized protein YacL